MKVIVALDFDTEREAMALVQALGDAADHYKIGIQTLTAVGPSLVPKMVIVSVVDAVPPCPSLTVYVKLSVIV